MPSRAGVPRARRRRAPAEMRRRRARRRRRRELAEDQRSRSARAHARARARARRRRAPRRARERERRRRHRSCRRARRARRAPRGSARARRRVCAVCRRGSARRGRLTGTPRARSWRAAFREARRAASRGTTARTAVAEDAFSAGQLERRGAPGLAPRRACPQYAQLFTLMRQMPRRVSGSTRAPARPRPARDGRGARAAPSRTLFARAIAARAPGHAELRDRLARATSRG